VPEGVRVLGSAAWEVKDKIADAEQRRAYVDAIRARTTGGNAMTKSTPFGVDDTGQTVKDANTPNFGDDDYEDPGGKMPLVAEKMAEQATAKDPSLAAGGQAQGGQPQHTGKPPPDALELMNPFEDEDEKSRELF
jgi:hypothetical protein